jgi:arylsulfatase A
MAQTYVGKANAFIEKNKDHPFFLYYATHEPHVPRWPDDRFRGKNPAGIRTESLEEMDWCIGEVMKKIDQLGLADNTLVIVSSDNGPAVTDGYDDGALEGEAKVGHKAAGPFRGGKYTPYEGGVREPFLVRWPAHIKQGGQVSEELVSLVDLLATAAALTGQPLAPQDGVDSLNVLPALTGSGPSPRKEASFQGNYQTPFPYAQALREGDWKLVCTPVSYRKLSGKETKADEGKPVAELYNLREDSAEAHNVAAQNPDKLRELFEKLVAQGKAGFTRPGAEKIVRPAANGKAVGAGQGAVYESDK